MVMLSWIYKNVTEYWAPLSLALLLNIFLIFYHFHSCFIIYPIKLKTCKQGHGVERTLWFCWWMNITLVLVLLETHLVYSVKCEIEISLYAHWKHYSLFVVVPQNYHQYKEIGVTKSIKLYNPAHLDNQYLHISKESHLAIHQTHTSV